MALGVIGTAPREYAGLRTLLVDLDPTTHPDADAVAVAISHSGATTDTYEFLRLAKESGAATNAITNDENSPLAGLADTVLRTAARESPLRSGALGSRIAQLLVVDCLFTGVAQANYEASTSALQRTYRAVARS